MLNLGRPPRRLVLLHLDGSDTVLPVHGDEVVGEKVRPEPAPGAEPERRAGRPHHLERDAPRTRADRARRHQAPVPADLPLIVLSHGIEVAAAQVEIVPADAGAAVDVPRLPRLGVR